MGAHSKPPDTSGRQGGGGRERGREGGRMGGEEGSGAFSVLGVRVCTGTAHVEKKEGEGRRRRAERPGRGGGRPVLSCCAHSLRMEESGSRKVSFVGCLLGPNISWSSANRPSVKMHSEHKDEEQGKHFE